jgi:hypothetical protein
VQGFVELLTSLGETPLSRWLAESFYAFPTLEVVHVFAISMVFGTVVIIDLRLLGLASTSRRYTAMAHELLPWTWAAFAVAALSGGLLVLSRPVGYFENADFRVKFLFMAMAGANMLVFHFVTSKQVGKWDRGPTPVAAKLAGAVSILLWVGIIYLARKTGFTMVQGGA